MRSATKYEKIKQFQRGTLLAHNARSPFNTLTSLFSWADRFESYLVANPEDRFFRNMAHMVLMMYGFIWATSRENLSSEFATR